MQRLRDSLRDACLHRHWSGFGTTVDVRLWPRPGRAVAGVVSLARSAAFLRRSERRFSRFLPMSELSLLNRRAGQPVCVSQPLFRLTAAALAASHATDGLFDPTIGRALLAAGYDRTFADLGDERGGDRLPNTEPGRYREVVLDADRRTVLLPAGVGLDLGGIAKGWLADAVARRLGRMGAAAVDLGGDVAFTAPTPGSPPWLIEVASPWSDDRPLAEVELGRGGGVATSGVVRRRWRTSRGWQHHLIDPRTGRPADTDLASVTVLGPTVAAAEVMAKAVLLLGRECGEQALAVRPGFAGILIPFHGAVIHVRTTSGQPASSPEARA
jgi:thiamine biosynthesis lipoprotein